MMDGGLQIENAIRSAVREKVDFYHFSDSARHVAHELGLSTEERDSIFGLLAQEIHAWIKERSS